MIRFWRGTSHSSPGTSTQEGTATTPHHTEVGVEVTQTQDEYNSPVEVETQDKPLHEDIIEQEKTTKPDHEVNPGLEQEDVFSAAKPATPSEPLPAPPKDPLTDQHPFPTTIVFEETALTVEESVDGGQTTSNDTQAPAGRLKRVRLMSFRSFAFFYGRDKSIPSPKETATPTPNATPEIVTKSEPNRSPKKAHVSKADERASSYAALLRSVIIGAPITAKALPSKFSAKGKFSKAQPPLKKLKSELLRPDEANRVIAQLRTLPAPDASQGVVHGTIRGKDGKLKEKEIVVVPEGSMPIHGVCLDCTDEEADALHFSHLTTSAAYVNGARLVYNEGQAGPSTSSLPPNLASADMSSLIPVLRDLKLIDLVSGTDFGFGQPAGSGGILAGSVPSSGALAEGLMQVGQQLLNLGFATSSAMLPSHAGIHPPLDRLSVLTYWWGYEVAIPPPSMKYLAHCKSISNALLNFLTAFSLFNNGVRELLPFIRYASQFVDFEWNAVKAQDKGKGVVCAATWVMPAALVPRAWDFDDLDAQKKAQARAFAAAGGDDASILTSLVPPPLPGTEIISQPIQPPLAGPNTPIIPLITLTPPMSPQIIEEEERVEKRDDENAK